MAGRTKRKKAVTRGTTSVQARPSKPNFNPKTINPRDAPTAVRAPLPPAGPSSVPIGATRLH